jgi:hypothetical protein
MLRQPISYLVLFLSLLFTYHFFPFLFLCSLFIYHCVGFLLHLFCFSGGLPQIASKSVFSLLFCFARLFFFTG